MTRVPCCKPAPIALVAASIPSKFTLCPASTATGTMTTTTSACRTASAVCVVAESSPSPLSLATLGTSPGSSTWDSPALIDSTTSGLISQPITRRPCSAYCTASGRPILPSPTTATVGYRLDERFCMMDLRFHILPATHAFLLRLGKLAHDLQDSHSIFARDGRKHILSYGVYHILILQAQRFRFLNLEASHGSLAYASNRT